MGVVEKICSVAPARTGASQTSAGFTLVELLIAMSIVGLVLSLATPRLAAMMPGARLRHTTIVLAADLRAVRNDAIAAGQAVAFRFDPAERRYRAGSDSSAKEWPDNVQLEIVVPGSMIYDAQKPQIWFYPDGSSSGGKILCSSAGRSYVVKVNWLAGWVTVQG